MFYHRHVVAVTPTFLENYGIFPSYAPLFVCENENAAARLRGKAPVPLLLGTESYNMRDAEELVNFSQHRPALRKDMATWKAELLTAKEIKSRLLQMPNVPGVVQAYINSASTRDALYNVAGAFKPRFAGMTTSFQDAGDFLSQGLMEVHVCIEGVATWRPPVDPTKMPLYRQYAPGDMVKLAPPGGYEKIPVGRVVDFLDENVARVNVNLGSEL